MTPCTAALGRRHVRDWGRWERGVLIQFQSVWSPGIIAFRCIRFHCRQSLSLHIASAPIQCPHQLLTTTHDADLSDSATGNVQCYSQIQFTVDAPLSCLPTFGGVYTGGAFTSGQSLPSNAGDFVIPSGTVYAPTYVQNIIIQQFITIYNININNIVIITPSPVSLPVRLSGGALQQ